MLLSAGWRLAPAVLLLLLGTPAMAQDDGTGPLSKAVARSIPSRPDPRHVFVTDSAHLFAPAEVAALQDSAAALQKRTGADIVFVTLPTLHGGASEEAALAIGRRWKVGSAGSAGDPARNRGIVLLYVLDKTGVAGGNLRAEVGRGLEGAITDGGGSRAILEAMKPGLRAHRYAEGFMDGYLVAADLITRDAPKFAPSAPIAPPSRHSARSSLLLAAFVVLLLALLVWIIRRGLRRPADAGPRTMVLPVADDDPPVGGSPWASFGQSDGGDGTSSSAGLSFGGGGDGGSDSSGGSDGGELGGGGGFSGGGASDSV